MSNKITVTIRNIKIIIPEQQKDAFTEEELNAYVERAIEKYGKYVKSINLSIVDEDPDMVDIEYDLHMPPFQRLRRITGYLVGDLSRWNDGKRAEEKDRVKHDQA